ncbi:hypothetical protein RRF57_002526 [Xylaria bambusicola]|uniref:Uncharacterized protein n=1 Tax=Xylaria bambusicola TaxID=326684 RepID=A0AAN7Z6Y2_9PEZI
MPIKQVVELFNHGLSIWFPLPIIFRIYVKTLCVPRISHVRLYGRADLTVIQSFPVDAVEEWVRFDLLRTTADIP